MKSNAKKSKTSSKAGGCGPLPYIGGSDMKTSSIKEYVEGYKGNLNCEGVTRLHEMESELNGWIGGLDAGIVASMEGEL